VDEGPGEDGSDWKEKLHTALMVKEWYNMVLDEDHKDDVGLDTP
jgi:hypothetical protein